MTLPDGSLVSVRLDGVPSRLGSVCWSKADGTSGVLHGIRFQVPLAKRGAHSRPLRRVRFRRMIRRALIILMGSAAIATAAYATVWLVESLRSYDPKYYEPKDIEREDHLLQKRLGEQRESEKP
jgi:hypothetical protein